MKLSILDQSPIVPGQTASDAFKDSLALAQLGEDLGYERYWLTEHHGLSNLASSAPEVLLSYIGAHTNHIRIGAGAILLPHYRPYKVAEQFNTLATLFANRVDLGIGRAPGGSAEATNALSTQFLKQVWALPELLEELLMFLEGQFPLEHEYHKVNVLPQPDVSPTPWLLGTSEKSALLAAKNGMPYVYGAFMSDQDGRTIVDRYREHFEQRNQETPKVIVTVSVICAETKEEAEALAIESLITKAQGEDKKEKVLTFDALSEREKEMLYDMKDNMIIGDVETVQSRLQAIQAEYQCDEIMVSTNTITHEDRMQSYRLLAQI
ncbi:LLM class flavin-dependent oxidoreductase [Mammaliicoccus sciuri]|uniref:LLM class flavin-dependent oxidoreductase n=1 Tax=Mammaliicoccus sciuri TaxID=1296 RepID=UPI000D1F7011|nr:LLM class flavin-dependent oxidoreductase [Mammaliicoccus sciuri]MBV5105926.1 LLM class flavin-dependent oxidoreductase [Mammaliicoccus sciuri]MEB5790099.1 LLM class flavin-dependent oxidoreductase [Mammaliicoccus sciuri]MEB8263964.1 LLM class flavin-dependent oxidoreductase [Mammaliicoccus sciuri]PTJ99565.1 LLM class flavin-dependent oxidoreductase [Mammaliicoccus sciuri]